MARVIAVLAVVFGFLLGGGPASVEEFVPDIPSTVPIYNAPHYDAPGSGIAQERAPPTAVVANTTYDAVEVWSHGSLVSPDGPATAATITYAYSGTPVQVARATTTTGSQVQVAGREFSSFRRFGVAAKSGVNLGPGVVTRKINWRPNAADPNWGLTGTHMNKHMFGNSKYSLSKIDPDGNADIWRGYMQDLASRPHTGTTTNGMLDIVGTFPRAGGGGNFQFGIRLSPNSNGSFDLITLLTKQ